MFVVTSEEMRQIDRLTIEKYGVPSLDLMERAGARITETILAHFGKNAKRGVVVVAGKGNNGGDGFVVARLLKKKRIPCEVVLLARRNELSPDAAHNFNSFRKIKGKVIEVSTETSTDVSRSLKGKSLIVDAILGTGVKNEVRGLYADAITAMNGSGLTVVAVDNPSGLDTDNGAPLGVAIKAKLTVSLGFAKQGQVIYPGLNYVGELVVADIGLDARALEEVAPKTELLTGGEIRALVPRRDPDTHKGTYGHLLVIAGSRGKTGAAIMACRAAMRSGAGLVTLAAPRSLNNVFASCLLEVMTELLHEDANEGMEILRDDDWRGLLERKSALVFGPGIGVSDATRASVRWLLRNLDLPWVIDADGLNNLSLEIERLRHAKTPPVLTPHPGEMARLMSIDTASVNRRRVEVARNFALTHRCHVILKGARTVIATAEGKIFINPTGNPGMASGGMGDVLSGILGALLAQGFSPEAAMKLGVYLHGFVADRIAAARGEIGMVASDIIEGLPPGLCALSMIKS